MMNLFAILHGASPVIALLPVTGKLQVDLTKFFHQQCDALLNERRDTIIFVPGFTPDNDQVSYIDRYSLPPIIENALANPASSQRLNLKNGDLPEIKGIIAADAESAEVLFQVFERHRTLSKRRFSLILSKDTFQRLQDPGITLDSKLAAAFRKGRLYFESYFVASRVLDLTAFYREATAKDIDGFCSLPVFEVQDPDQIAAVADTWERRKIAAILESGSLKQGKPRRIQQMAKTYGLDFKITRKGRREHLVLPSVKKDLQQLLRFLEEDYFTSILTKTKYMANSKRRI